ncbi:MAG: hypothetical protein WAL26_18235, partial [Mycobacterium sp.]
PRPMISADSPLAASVADTNFFIFLPFLLVVGRSCRKPRRLDLISLGRHRGVIEGRTAPIRSISDNF